jgi:hypothetical protein
MAWEDGKFTPNSPQLQGQIWIYFVIITGRKKFQIPFDKIIDRWNG